MRLFRTLTLALLLPLPALAQPTILCAPPPPPHGGAPGCGGGGGNPEPINPPPCCNQQNILVGDPASIRLLRTPADQLPPALRPLAKLPGGGTYSCLTACVREDQPEAGSGYLQMSLVDGRQHLFSSFLTLINPEAFAAGAEMRVMEIELRLADGSPSHYTLSLLRQRTAAAAEARAGESTRAPGRHDSYHALLEQDGQLLRVLPLASDLGRQQQLPLLLSTDQHQGQLQFDLGGISAELSLPAGSRLQSLRVGQLETLPQSLSGSLPSLWFFDLRLNRDGREVAL